MYEASDLFKKAISQINRELRIRVTIGNKIYEDTDIQECSIEESILTGEDFKFGSATAARLDLILLNMDESLTARSFEGNEVLVEIGVLLDKFSQPFEYVSMGFFVVEEAKRDKSLIKLTGYDKMIYFESPYVSTLIFPVTLKQILQEVCSLAGVELETNSFVNDDFVIEECPDLSNVTLRNVLEYISELSCSFASINRAGKLELVTLKETDTLINADNYYEMNLSEYEYGPIDQIAISQENIFVAYVTQDQIDNIHVAVQGFTFKPFATTWQGNPLTAPGDIITVTYRNGTPCKSFIANQKFTFSTGLKCDITTNAKTAIRAETETPGPITKVVESTKNEIKSKFEQVNDRITLEVDSINGEFAEVNTSLEVMDGKIESKVSLTDYTGTTITSLITQDAFSISFLAQSLNLQGLVTFTNLNTPGQTVIDGGNIKADSLSADAIIGGTMTGAKWQSLDDASPFEIYIGTSSKYQTLVVHNGALHLYYTDPFDGIYTQTIFAVETNGNAYTNNKLLATQEWVYMQGYSTGGGIDYHPNSVDWVDTYRIQRGGASLKFLVTVPTIQARNYYDTGWGNFEGNAYSNVSKREYKKDIGDYTGDALTDILNTPVHTYRYTDDLDTEPLRIGLIYDEVPMEIMQFNSGVDIYAMASMMWKGIQQLKEEIDILKGEV